MGNNIFKVIYSMFRVPSCIRKVWEKFTIMIANSQSCYVFKNAFVPKSLSSTNFEIVFKKKPTLLNVITLKYREEFIYGYNFINNTIKEKLFLYGKDFLRAE